MLFLFPSYTQTGILKQSTAYIKGRSENHQKFITYHRVVKITKYIHSEQSVVCISVCMYKCTRVNSHVYSADLLRTSLKRRKPLILLNGSVR